MGSLGGRMTTKGTPQGQFFLQAGPSQEKLFDCLRLGLKHDQLSTVECEVLEYLEEIEPRTQWSKTREQRMLICIQGIHQSPGVWGDEWFFWGRVQSSHPGDVWKTGDGHFVFGKWYTQNRSGRILFSQRSFFESPLKDE